MWYLTAQINNKVLYVVGPNKEVVIGRNADPETFSFVIPDDPSISRKHAVLTLTNNDLFLKDLGSRYGTFLNGGDDKIDQNATVSVNDGDVITFGKMGNAWKVHKQSLVTCTSTLKGENLQNLRQCLSKLSGTLKNEWDESCLYLTMPAITLTMKVVLALVRGAYIVTIDYWNKCLEAVNNQAPLPDPKNYMPQIIESTLNKENVSFLPNINRQSLFLGKKIVFFSKRQYEMYKVALKYASATPLLLSECKMSKSALCEKDIVVIQYNMTNSTQETQTQRNLIQDIINYLNNKGKRVVTDVEIGLAVLYCTTEKYCNPDFNFPSEVINQTNTNSKPSTVLAQESQEPSQQVYHDNVIIDESLSTSLSDEKSNSKRKVSDLNDSYYPKKKMAVTVNVNAANNNGSKRRFSDDNNEDSNPSKKLASDIDSNDSQEAFKFVKTGNCSSDKVESSTKRLNLIKPQKRKIDNDNEDDLFQFVQEKSKMPCTSKSAIFDNSKVVVNVKKEIDTASKNAGNSSFSSNVDVSSLRGAKLEELMKKNEKLFGQDSEICKREIKEEVDEKISQLCLGMTIVTIKKELIVKKEPVHVEEINTHVKNFKKFKKVWPLKTQVTISSKSSILQSQLDSDKSTASISV